MPSHGRGQGFKSPHLHSKRPGQRPSNQSAGETGSGKGESFPKGAYSITDHVSGASKRVTELAYARWYKQSKDMGRKAGHKRDLALEQTTLGEYWERWSKRPSKRTGKDRRETTAARIESTWRVHIAPAFADVPIRSMTVSDVIDWHASLKGDENKALRTLRSILAGAVAEVSLPRTSQRQPRSALRIPSGR